MSLSQLSSQRGGVSRACKASAPCFFFTIPFRCKSEHNRDQPSTRCFVITSIIAKEDDCHSSWFIHGSRRSRAFPRELGATSLARFSKISYPLIQTKRKKPNFFLSGKRMIADRTKRSLQFLCLGKKRNPRRGEGREERKSKGLRKSGRNDRKWQTIAWSRPMIRSCILHREEDAQLFSFYFFFPPPFFFLLLSSFFFFFTAEIFPNIRSRSRNQSDYPRYVASTRVHQHKRWVAIGRGSRAFFHCSAVVWKNPDKNIYIYLILDIEMWFRSM